MQLSYPALRPVLFWLLILALCGDAFRQNNWEILLVLFAALVLVPKGLRILNLQQPEWFELLPALFSLAFLIDGYWFLALPYTIWAVWQTLKAATELLIQSPRKLEAFVRVFALGYWATGASFAVFFLAGISPLGFDPVIVALTAAHFHLAGFVLSVLVYALLQMNINPANRILGKISLIGMPLVAAGITLSKLGYPPLLEQISALGFVMYALAIGLRQFGLASKADYPKTIRLYWMAGAACLICGLSLAALYALRFQFPISWVHIPNMKIWHGTLNTLGFAWLSLTGYELVLKSPPLSPAT